MSSSRPDSIEHVAKAQAGKESVPTGAGPAAKHFGGESNLRLKAPTERHKSDLAASTNVSNRPGEFRRVEFRKKLPVGEDPIPNGLSAPREPIDIAVVDDEEGTRWFLPRILNRSGEFRCNGCYASAEEAIREIPRLSPQVALMSIQLPEISDIECMRRLKSMLPALSVVLVSALADLQIMSDALKAGADGYLIKPFAIAQCLATLRLATRRDGAGAADGVELDLPSVRRGDGCARLTPRENEVMCCFARGLLYKETADALGISFSAVHKHQQCIYRKLGVANRTEALTKYLGPRRD